MVPPRLLTGETIPYTELAPAEPGDPLAAEWETYRREVGRLLSEGREGQFVLIKDETIIGFYDTEDAARAAGLERYLGEPFLVHQVRSREPLIRVPFWFHLWHGSRSPCRQIG
jgi:hypothetical protein